MNVSVAQRLRALETEDTKLNKLLANTMLDLDAMRGVLKGEQRPWQRAASSCGNSRNEA